MKLLLVAAIFIVFIVDPMRYGARAAAGDPELPDITNSFSVVIEATIGQYNRTIPIREMIDYDNSKSRFEIWSVNSTEVHIEDWANVRPPWRSNDLN